MNSRYGPVIKKLQQTDWDAPKEMQSAAISIENIMQDSGVKINPIETVSIITEVQKNPNEMREVIINIDKSLKEFNTVISKYK